MIHARDVLKAGGRVAIFTGVSGADVGGVLAGGVHAIVTACAIASNAGVIK